MKNTLLSKLILSLVIGLTPVIGYSQTKLIDKETITANDGTKTYLIAKSLSIQPPNSSTSVVFTATGSTSYVFRMANPDPQNFPPSTDQNFVRTEAVLINGITSESSLRSLPVTQKNMVYDYIDGLGRKVQSVNWKNSSLQNDNVLPAEFDPTSGREPKNFLPYAVSQTNAAFRTAAVDEQSSFYKTPSANIASDGPNGRPYSESFFESSPLNRITSKFGPGIDWKDNNRDVKSMMKINQGTDNIIRWDYYLSGIPTENGVYPSNYLVIQETTDEEAQITREYKDSRGLLVMKQVGDGTNWFYTHYIYSPAGLLMLVIQPEGVSRLATEFENKTTTEKQSFLDRWCFQYQYDDEQRMIAKRTPGWEPNYWAYTVYDQWNRPVLNQTPAQSARNEWSFTKYDRFNRAIMSGVYTTTTVLSTLRTNATASNTRFETEATTAEGYTLTATFPSITSNDLQTITYYDYYSFLTYPNWETDIAVSNFNFQNIIGYAQYNSTDANASEIFWQVKGHPTGSKTKVLGTNRWLNGVTWYDKKYRPIQIISENYVGGFDRSTSKVDFIGKTLNNLLNHTAANSISANVLREFEYDHAGRLMKTWQTTDGGTRTLLSANNYNEIGQLVEKNIHSTDNGSNFLQSVDMRYNIRGWLTNINNSTLANDGTLNNDANDLFGMEMLYNPETQPTVNGYKPPKLYNGNISAIKWMSNTQQSASEQRIFGFNYDILNRFNKAWYATNNAGAWTGNAGMFDEAIRGYDKNGNIQGIERYANVENNRTRIDSTYYVYNYKLTSIPNFKGFSNRLIRLKDAGNTRGFKDGADQPEEYRYDPSGNLIFDWNKSISNITYNYLNLPEIIEFTINNRASNPIDRIVYTYTATGAKLKTDVYQYGTSGSYGTRVWTTEYAGELQYDQSQTDAARVLSFAATPEGRVIKNGNSWDYEYFYKDHQGNVRLTYGNLKQTLCYKATMENPNAAYSNKEETDFKNISTTRDPSNNYTKPTNDVVAPDKSSVTNAFTNQPIGPAKSLTLSSGDKVKVDVFARYNQISGVASAPVAATTLITALATTTFGFNVGETGYNSFNNNVGGIPGKPPTSSTLPKAYLAYLFFDTNYNFVAGSSSAVSISTNAYNAFEKLSLSFTATQAGYLYVYVANENNVSASVDNVYWDDMLIVHQKSNSTLQVTQASDYYPFGLPFNTYQVPRIKDNYTNVQNNRYGFQGQEWQSDLDLGWSQFKWRMHDPAIGRFGAVDPLSDKYLYNSTYDFSENRLLDGVELEGKEFFNPNILGITEALAKSRYGDDPSANQYTKTFFGVMFGMTDYGQGLNNIVQGTSREVSSKVDFAFNGGQNITEAAKSGGDPQQVVDNYQAEQKAGREQAIYGMAQVGIAGMKDQLTLFGAGLGASSLTSNSTTFGISAPKLTLGGTQSSGLLANKAGTSLWPAASSGRTTLNGIEYTTHALDRMQPVGTIMKGSTSFSRGIPPSVVEHAVKYGTVTPGNTAAEVVRTFDNVRVITNPSGSRIISVIKIGN